MNDVVAALQRPHLAAVEPYVSARRSASGGSVWLNANEAPFTPAAAADEQWCRYPDFQNPALNQAYAEYAGVAAHQVLSCRGSDEAIELLIRSFCEPAQDAVMITTPTYGMYAISAATHGAKVVDCPLQPADDGTLQLATAAMIARCRDPEQAPVKLIFICSPSNPLGNLVATDALVQLLEAIGTSALVVLDQAYIEFIADNHPQYEIAELLQRYPQLVVLRTLSKAFGRAGLRCGFALAAPAIIAVLSKVIAPYPLPSPTISEATHALSCEAIMLMQQQLEAIAQQRRRLVEALQQRSWVEKIWPSTTNFVLVNVTDAATLIQRCQNQGVLIRNQSSQPGLPQCIRISIGSADDITRLLEVLPA